MRPATTIRGYDLLAMAIVLGVAGGLLEGVVHMVLQRFMLENVWYQIIWIAPAFNGLVLTAFAAVLALALTIRPVAERGRTVVTFSLVFAAWLPCIALMLKAWIHPAAIFILAVGTSVAATRSIVQRERRVLEFFRRGTPVALSALLLTVVVIEGGFELRERILTGQLPAPREDSPDVLLLIVDTLRADHLSSYGYTRSQTPNLDRLARDGVLFETAFSTSSWTVPAHVSMLTGLYPREHGVEWLTSKNWGSTVFRTLPEMLRDRGYRTAAFSGNTYWISREHGFGRGFLHFEDFFHSPQDMAFRTAYGRIVTRVGLPRLGWRDVPGRKRAEDTNRALLAWMRETDRPAFAMVNYFDVHDPYLPPREYGGQNGGEGLINSVLGTPAVLTEDQVRTEIAAYDGLIRYVDAQIGRLLSGLRQRSGRDLFVVVVSDHGEEFGEHGGYGHGNHLYRETIHVPLLFWRPGRVPAGLRVSTPVSVASVPATIMEQLDAAPPDGAAPSLEPLWSAEAPAEWPAPRLELAQRPWESERTPVRHGAMRSLVKWPWHFIDHAAFGPELYDIVRDTLEQQNKASNSELHGLVSQFRTELGRPPHVSTRRETAPPGVSMRQRLHEVKGERLTAN